MESVKLCIDCHRDKDPVKCDFDEAAEILCEQGVNR